MVIGVVSMSNLNHGKKKEKKKKVDDIIIK